MKYYRTTFEYALYDLSYTNLTLYYAAIPSYSFNKDKEKEQETLDASDPANWARIRAQFRNR